MVHGACITWCGLQPWLSRRTASLKVDSVATARAKFLLSLTSLLRTEQSEHRVRLGGTVEIAAVGNNQ
jgi:hypothetical protein